MTMTSTRWGVHCEATHLIRRTCTRQEQGAGRRARLEVFEHFDGVRLGLPHRIVVRLRGPHKVGGAAERLVAPGERRVDDKLSVAADGDEAAVAVVLERRREDFAAAQVLHRTLLLLLLVATM